MVRRTRQRGFLLIDAIVGTVLLGVALSVCIGLAGRAIAAQSLGQEMRTAAMLIDEQLNLIVMRGPDDYSSRYGLSGQCEAPFEAFGYVIEMGGGQGGDPYSVTVTVSWVSGGRERAESVQTLIAPRLGDDPDPERRPEEDVTRW